MVRLANILPRSREKQSSELEKGHPAEPSTTSQGSRRYAASTAESDHKGEIRKTERWLLFKLDILIIPFAMLLYLSAYLDRGNLGNARLQGLQSSVLRGSDTNYSTALSCFFITYVILSIPGTLLAKAFVPSRVISAGALIWSIAATCQAGAVNPAGLYVCRLFVGVGEAMFGQPMAFYLSLWYKKDELAKRVGLWITAGSLAGAFSGLIAYGVQHIPSNGLAQWHILFLIEGLPSLLLAICVFFFLPSRPENSRYLTQDQQALACDRLNADSIGETGTGIDWRAVKYEFASPRNWIAAVMYSCMNLGLGSVGGFLPTIIKNFGYTNAEAQLYTVPPYAVCVVFMFLLTSFSDRYQTRGIPTACVFLIGLVGWTILYTVDPRLGYGDQHARYFACICVVTAGYSAIPLIVGWQSNNCPSESQRAVALGALNSVGQCLSILAAFLFPSDEGPYFSKGCSVNLAFQCLGFVIAIGLTVYYRLENARRDEAEGGRPPRGKRIDCSERYDKSIGFRYVV